MENELKMKAALLKLSSVLFIHVLINLDVCCLCSKENNFCTQMLTHGLIIYFDLKSLSTTGIQVQSLPLEEVPHILRLVDVLLL